MPSIIPHDSIDALIARQLPSWLAAADSDQLHALQAALHSQQNSVEQVRAVLAEVTPLDDFAAPLLAAALQASGIAAVDVRGASVHIAQDVELPSAASHLPKPWHTFHSRQSLLAAALHNFREDEGQPSMFRRVQFSDAQGQPLAIDFGIFCQLCRRLDLGGRYQRLLKAKLQPEGASQAVKTLFQEHQRAQCEVAVRVALLKGELDARSYQQVRALLSARPVVPSTPEIAVARQLLLLGKQVRGVVAIEVRASAGAPVMSVITWAAGDPRQPVERHASWEALYQLLGRRLRDPGYRRFFARFISERDRPAFDGALARLLRSTPAGSPVQLDGRNQAITGALFEHQGAQLIDKWLDDARVLAVPTDDEDSAARRERLQGYLAAGLDLLGLIGLFIPVVGELMLVVTAEQIVEELYEGYQDWQLGDRQGALDHLFGVAQGLVVGAVVGKAVEGAQWVVRRSAFVDGLAPLRAEGGKLRLCSDRLPGYPMSTGDSALGHLTPAEGSWRLGTEEGAFHVVNDLSSGTLKIRHPSAVGRHAPVVESNDGGGWRHEFEQPHYWEGAGQLLRRLGRRTAGVSEATSQALLDTTGYTQAQLRRLHLEGGEVPARLLDALERHALHEQFPALQGAAFDEVVALRQVAATPNQGPLLRDFPGLSVRGAQEILDQASSAQVEAMQRSARVPLALAERARWYLRDSRLDRACAGLSLAQAVNADTERLALGLLDHLAPWPAQVRVELREASAQGVLLASRGGAEAGQVVTLVRGGKGYRVLGDGMPGDSTLSLMQALQASLGPQQKAALGDRAASAEGLRTLLAATAAGNREQAAGLIGLAPVGAGFRPPLRFADGRLGYPLSGRGESSRQALGRGIRQIFPTLTSLQLEAYLMDVLGRGADLWEHYAQLSGQLTRLRQLLQAWQSGWRNPLDALRRRRVATAIRRAWRRKSMGLDGRYVLEIDGEPVGSMPDLPPGLEFGHIGRLVLRNMQLSQLPADFLSRFSALVELDLRHNQLSEIPQGLETLSGLRQLHLGHNHIALDAAGNARLAPLTRLQVLDLSHNPLGALPSVGDLPHLRRLLLRSTAQQRLPEQGGELPWRALVDLRDNRIRELRQDVSTLRQRLQRLYLHDNPLEEADEVQLDEAREVPDAAAWGSASYRHVHADASVKALWLGSSKGELLVRRDALWGSLEAEEGSADLFRFLADFSATEDFEENPRHYRRRIWHILETCAQHEALRHRLFREVGGERTCDDRLLLVLSQLEVAVMAEQATVEGPPAQAEQRLLRLGRALFRLDEVDRFAARHVQGLRERSSSLVDEIEVRLFFRVSLAHALRLPAQPEQMHYPEFASVTAADVLRAKTQVLQAESREALVAALAERPFWQSHLHQRHTERFEALAAPFHERLQRLTETVEQSGAYVQRSNALMEELQRAERELVLTLTREAYSRSPT